MTLRRAAAILEAFVEGLKREGTHMVGAGNGSRAPFRAAAGAVFALCVCGGAVSGLCARSAFPVGAPQGNRLHPPGEGATGQNAPNREESGFVPLFDGKTLRGWRALPEESASDWSVRNGVIVGRGSADRLSYLVRKEDDFEDFELRLAYRLPGKGNTGIEIRARPDVSRKRPLEGYHADLGHPGIGAHILGAWDFHFAERREPPCPRGTDLLIRADETTIARKIPGALTAADVRAGDWNEVRIIARGNRFEFSINGKPASAFTDEAAFGRLEKGTIGLQIHDKGMVVEFKDIRIKRLPRRSARIPVGRSKQLLADDYAIEEARSVRRELGPVEKVGVVLEPSLPTDFIPPPGKRGHPEYERKLGTGKKPDGTPIALDFGFYTTVLWNEREGKFQMWYMPWRLAGVAYAESEDGIHWTKPLLGRGGKDNIVHPSQSFGCSLDPTLPWGHPEKYKAAFDSNLDRDSRTCLAYSADGIRWFPYNGGKPVTHRAADTFNQILWDPVRRRYRLSCRTDMGGKGGASEYRSVRIMVHDGGNDLKRHPTAWKTIADRIVVEDPRAGRNRFGGPRLQFNWLTCWYYEGIYFGLMNVYTMDRADFFEGFDYVTRHEEDVLDFYIGTSRDGVRFDQSWIRARKPFVPRGPAGSFDKDGVFPASQIVTRGDEHWIYYGGASERHYSIGRDMKIGLAKVPLDRFIALLAGPEGGTVLTKPFLLEGSRVAVNIDARRGAFRLEALGEDGSPLPGVSPPALYEGVDALRFEPELPGLEAHRGRPIRLRFHLQNARLYAFQIR